MTASPPNGFTMLPLSRGFIDHNGPYYWRKDESGTAEYGSRAMRATATPTASCMAARCSASSTPSSAARCSR
jgi:hypothetical protein